MAVALPAVTFCVRTAVAAWLVEPTPYLAPPSPTADLGVIERAASWAPGEARYPFFAAMVLRREMRTHWLDEEASELGRRAAEASAAANTLVGMNPYFHRLAGAIALERARLPGTSEEQREMLVDAGLRSLHDALALNPESPLLQQLVGLELVSSWDVAGDDTHELALESLRKASTANPGYLASTLSSLWLKLPADERWSALRRVVPDTSAEHAQAARFLESLLPREGPGEDSRMLRQAAIDEYLAAATVEGPELAALQNWVTAHARLQPDRHDALLARVEQLVEEFPDRPEAWITLARAGALAQDHEGAMAATNRAVALTEGLAGNVRAAALQERAAIHLARGEAERAVSDLQGAAATLPGVAGIRLRLAAALEAAGRDDDALEAYEAAVRVEPGSVRARTELARAYARRFKYLAAIEQWRRVLARNPDAFGPNLEIARLYRTLNLPAEAIDYYSRALEIDPENGTARRELNALLQGRRQDP